jgi:hypothetical protein
MKKAGTLTARCARLKTLPLTVKTGLLSDVDHSY